MEQLNLFYLRERQHFQDVSITQLINNFTEIPKLSQQEF